MENQNDAVKSKAVQTAKRLAMSAGVVLASTATAFAADGDVSIDLTTALGGVLIIGGLMAAGTLKAMPTYAAWGIRKALSMLR